MAQIAAGKPLGRSRLPAADVVVLTLLAYVPFLFSSPGKLSSDTKQYLYLDPGRFLTRVPWLWDPHVAAGTVPHQQIGYLFPMGPYYWVLDRVGVPDWIAQRIWLGTISVVAALGARWLFRELGIRRVGAMAGAIVYVLTPYQLAFTARMSVLLLPWAALPWIVGLAMRATRRGGWRDPAAIALILLVIGGVNASALLLMGIAPALWMVMECCAGRERARAALGASARIAVLGLGVSLWWVAGLWLQGSQGLPVLALTENVQTVSTASSPADVLRGLGNWFFYGRDASGYSLVQTQAYLSSRVVVTASFLVPALGLLAGVLVRWRHRAYFAACVIVGTIIGVGAWPYEDSTPYGHLWRSFTSATAIGLALRNSPRVVPMVVLGIAGLLAAGVAALPPVRVRVLGAAGIVGLAILALLPVWQHGFLSPGVERPEHVPAYWTDAVRAMDRGSHTTRILEIPGSSFATYRWGNTVEPITPGLTSRPYLAREVLPYGSLASVNLLDAFDRRLQNGSFEPATVAPLSRLFGVGTVALRSDLAYERSGSPHPRVVWAALTDPLAPGITGPRAFGPPSPDLAPNPDGIDLRLGADTTDPPPVALFGVRDPLPIVRTAPDRDPVLLSGDGDGIVDLAAAGLIDGRERLLELASLDRTAVGHALDTGAALVLTDSNRRRITSYFSSIRDTKGATERAGHTTHDVNGYGTAVDPFPGSGDGSRTVVEQRGATVSATADGGPARPEDRAAAAFDGELRTSWRVGGPDPTGEAITVHPDRPVRTGHVDLVQPLDLPRDRWITQVRITVNHGTPFLADLGDASFTTAGQRVQFPRTTVRSLRIEIAATHDPPFDPQFANAVGFAEIRLGHVRVHETVRLPVDLVRRIGTDAGGHSLAVVMTRLRQETATGGRHDEELALDRRFVLPDARTFTLGGTARIDPDAPGPTIDQVLGTAVPGVEFSASSHLTGDLDARASRAFTGDPSTAWTSGSGPQTGQWIQATTTTPVTASRVTLDVLVDARHSTPRHLTLLADGREVAHADVAPPADASDAVVPTAVPVELTFPATTARSFRVLVDAADAPAATPDAAAATTPPVSFGLIAIPGVPAAPVIGTVSTACRAGLVRVDGRDRPVRITGSAADARTGLTLELCDGPLTLGRGSHTIDTTRGWDTAVDVDRVVLTSGDDGGASPTGRLVSATSTGTTVHVRDAGSTHARLTVRTDGRPFWLVMGQSHNDAWRATADGHALGAPSLADGYANAWLVHPEHAGVMTITLDWPPQRVVWIALALSSVAVLTCLGILFLAWRRRRATPVRLADEPVLAMPWTAPGPTLSATTTVLVTGVTLAVAALVAPVEMALGAAAAAALAARLPATRPWLGAAAALALLGARIGHRPELGWLALGLFGAAVLVTGITDRVATTRSAPPD